MPRSAHSGRHALCGLLAVVAVLPIAARADDSADPVSFREVLTTTTRQQMQTIAGYIAEHPDAADADEARRWLFMTAVTRGLQGEAARTAERYLETEETDADLAQAAHMIRSVSLVREEEFASAMDEFRDVLGSTRLRAPDSTVFFAEQLAVELQLGGQADLAKEVFDELSQRFAILPEVRRRMENRLDKLGLVGKPAPALGLDTLEGEAIDLQAIQGKVVLVDFWATNCRPCLEMLPLLKRLHQRYGERDLVVVGVSLDDAPQTVRPFAAREKMEWLIAMDDGEASNAYHVRTIPSLFVVGRDGRVAYVDTRDESLETAVGKLVAKDEAKGKP